MLVLSRRPNQKVVFPGLGITIEVLRSRGSVVRLGIEAPENVAILRDEVMKSSNDEHNDSDLEGSVTHRELHHRWQNKLNEVMLKLQLLQRQSEVDQLVDLEHRLSDIFAELNDLEKSTLDAVVENKKRKILIVEDHPNERELLATCLRMGGFEVATAGNGREAFDYLHDHDLPDLVLLDMRMPDMDGPTFLKAVRTDFRLHDLRIFAVSGSSRNEFDDDPLQLNGWISKPVRIDALIQAVGTDRSTPKVKV